MIKTKTIKYFQIEQPKKQNPDSIRSTDKKTQCCHTMRQVARGDRGRHDTPHVSGEEGEGFSGTTVQTPTTGSGEDWREEAQWGRNEERDGERRSGKKEGRTIGG